MKTALKFGHSARWHQTCSPINGSPKLKHVGAAFIASVIFHVLVVYVFYAGSTSHLQEQAGRAGSALSFSVSFYGANPTFQPTTANEMPASPLPAARQIVERAEIVVAHKATPIEPKPVKHATPVPKNPRPLHVAKNTEHSISEKHASAQHGADTPVAQSQTAPAYVTTGGAANTPGTSTSGNARQGAGSATTVHLRVLNRRVNYPSRARSMGVEGRVKAQFDITESGTIKNIRILAEDPPGVFGADLQRDISRWRYDTTGEIKDQIVTVIFKIDGRIQLVN